LKINIIIIVKLQDNQQIAKSMFQLKGIYVLLKTSLCMFFYFPVAKKVVKGQSQSFVILLNASFESDIILISFLSTMMDEGT